MKPVTLKNFFNWYFQVEFPFLVLLISGGHSLLAVAQSSTHFKLLGQSLDDAPGEAMDKVSLFNLSNECEISSFRNKV